jgi:transaldolase
MKKFETLIFLDGGDPEETSVADGLLRSCGLPGVEGLTTNPSLIVKNLTKVPGGSHAAPDTESAYRRVVREMSKVTRGPISIQVTGSPGMSADAMLLQARDRVRWIPNAVIKFPCTPAGLKAANIFCMEGAVNITLVFSQEQAAAVYQATRNRGIDTDGRPFDVYVSPFVGRLDDRGENGMDVVSGIISMYRTLGDGHVKVLTASVRTPDHLQYALFLKSDIISIPFTLLSSWAGEQCPVPDASYVYDRNGLVPISYKDIPLDRAFWEYDITHPLTEAGVEKFWNDWTKNQQS